MYRRKEFTPISQIQKTGFLQKEYSFTFLKIDIENKNIEKIQL